MHPDIRARAEALFLAAVDRPPGEREAFLTEACGGDGALRAEVESLLAHHVRANGFLDSQALSLPALDDEAGAAKGNARPDAPEAVALPEVVGGYRIVSRLGEGGMAVVYLAEQERPRRRVALKVIRPGLATPEIVRRFEKEAEFLGRLHHPGVAQVYEVGWAEAGGARLPFIAMEWVEGRALTAYADARRLGTRARLELIIQVCAAVEHAHGAGVVHRDLKPGNILVDAEGRAKVLDFGVARLTDADVRTTTLRTDVGQLVGTVGYMSPEQASGDPARLDHRSDIYSLGVITYELLAGRLPYELDGKLVFEAVRVIREDEPVALGSVDRRFRGDLETIVAKALEKEPGRRYPSAAEFAADLQRYLSDEPIVARRTSTLYQLIKFSRRHRELVAGAVLSVLVLLVAAVGMTWQAVRATREARLARAAERNEALRRAEADEAREGAEAVTRFLTEMLASANPEQYGREVRVQDVVEDAARTVGAEFAERPLLEARLRAVIGASFQALGNYPASQEHLERALEVRRRELGEDHEDTLASMHGLAGLLVDLGERARAETLQRAALDGRRAQLGDDHAATLQSMNDLAELYRQTARFEEAEELFRACLEARRRTLGDEHPDTLSSLNNLGILLKDTGKASAAEPMLRAALAGRRRQLGEDHPRTLTTKNTLAGVLSDVGQQEEAEELYRQVLDGRVRVLGPEHPVTFRAKNNLGLLLQTRGQLEEAESLLREALSGRERTLGEDHPETLGSQNNLALLLLSQGKFGEAEVVLRKAVASQRRVQGEEHPQTLTTMNNLAFALFRQGKTDEAESLTRQLVESNRRVRGADHPETINSLHSLAMLLQGAGRAEEAAEVFEDVLRRAEQAFSAKDFRVGLFKSGYGLCLMRLERHVEAEEQLLGSHALLVERLGAAHARTRETVNRIAQLYEIMGRAEEAAAWRTRLAESGD